jgi:hypothetical protein
VLFGEEEQADVGVLGEMYPEDWAEGWTSEGTLGQSGAGIAGCPAVGQGKFDGDIFFFTVSAILHVENLLLVDLHPILKLSQSGAPTHRDGNIPFPSQAKALFHDNHD